MRHRHPCPVPGCKDTAPCDGVAVIDTDEDGIRGGYMTCDAYAGEALCDDHADQVPCVYCGVYGHGEACCEDAKKDAT